jgi:hypothetical protein
MKKNIVIPILLILLMNFSVIAQFPTPDPSAEPSASIFLPDPRCGNGEIDPGEACDLTASNPFNGKTCATLEGKNYIGGILNCYPRNDLYGRGCTFNTMGCYECLSPADCRKKLVRTYCSRDGNLHADSAICNNRKCEPGEIEKCTHGCRDGTCLHNGAVERDDPIFCNPEDPNPDQCPSVCVGDVVRQGTCVNGICSHEQTGGRDCSKEYKNSAFMVCKGGDCRSGLNKCEDNSDCPGRRPHCETNVMVGDKLYAVAVVSQECESDGYCTGGRFDNGERRIVNDCTKIEIDGVDYDYTEGYCVALDENSDASDYCDGPPIPEEFDGPCNYVPSDGMDNYNSEANYAYYCSEDGSRVYRKECTSHNGGMWRKRDVRKGTRDDSGDYKYCFHPDVCKVVADKVYTTKTGTVSRAHADCVEPAEVQEAVTLLYNGATNQEIVEWAYTWMQPIII